MVDPVAEKAAVVDAESRACLSDEKSEREARAEARQFGPLTPEERRRLLYEREF